MLVLAVMLVAFACGDEPLKQQATGVRALPDGSALILWKDQARVQWLARVDASGATRWTQRLDGRSQSLQMDLGMQLTDDFVAVRTLRSGEERSEAFVEGFSLDGQTRWKYTLGELGPHAESFDGMGMVSGYTFKNVFYENFKNSRGRWVVAIDARTGVEITRAELPLDLREIDMRADHVVVGDWGQSMIVRHVGSKLDVIPAHRECAGRGWRLFEPEQGKVSLEARGVQHALEPADAHLSIDRCAEYGDRIVVVVRNGSPLGGAHDLRIYRHDGSMIARQPLASDLARDEVTDLFPERGTQGAVPRFMPLIQVTGTFRDPVDARIDELVMFDLKQGTIAWRMFVRHRPLIIRQGTLWYIIHLGNAYSIAIVNGATGQLVAAKRFEGTIKGGWGLGGVSAASLSGPSLWLYSRDWVKDATKHLVRLDPSTLNRIGGSDVKAFDVSTATPFANIPRR